MKRTTATQSIRDEEQSRDRIVDGYIVSVRGDDYLWMIKDCYHPPKYYIAVPRYGPRGEKLKILRDSWEIAEARGYIIYDYCLGKLVPAIPRILVDQVLSPYEWKPAVGDQIDNVAMKFREIISHYANVSLEEIGITGSLLARKLVPGLMPEDIDIVVSGISEAVKVYKALQKMRAEGVTRPIPYTIRPPDAEVLDRKSRIRLMRKRLLEGIFEGYHYSIRLIPCKTTTNCIHKIRLLSRWNGVIEIVEQLSPYISPYTYSIRVVATSERNPRPQLLVSTRIRFSEIPVGTRLYVEGDLEYNEGLGVLQLCPDHPGSKVKLL